MKVKKKIAVWCALFALLVALVPLSSAKAEDDGVVEWSNFGEYWIAQGYSIEDLPFEFDGSKQYFFFKSYTNRYYIYVYPEGTTSYGVQNGSSGNWVGYGFQNAEAVYESSSNNPFSWNNIINTTKRVDIYNFYTEHFMYSDFCWSCKGAVWHRTCTGENVNFQFALADMEESLKTTLQGYDNYVVAKIPYRANDWQSEQIMIAVSNSSKVIYRSQAYNQIFFTTGSGYDAGLSYKYCSCCCQWVQESNQKAYILGDTVASGGKYPDILWTNCDVYYENGITYGLTDEIYFEAYPYDGEEDAEVEKEVVTSGFPRLFEVDAPVAYVYKYMDKESSVVLAMLDGSGGIVTGVEYDDAGKAWYKVSRYYANAEYVGYVDARLISVGYSTPSTGGSAGGGTDGGTDVPVPTPVIPDGGGESLSDNISEFTTFVASVPLIIASLFSFLPPWCLALTGVGFAILIFVMVKRATVG